MAEWRNGGLRSWGLAIGGAVFAHAILALAVVLSIEWAPGPTVAAELDLSSVELSFAEKPDAAEDVAPSPPMPSMQTPTKPPLEKPPEIRPEQRLPPDPSAYKFPEPKEEQKRFAPSAPSEPAEPSRLSQAKIDAPPCPKRTIRPEYPKGARQRGEQGNVVLEIGVGADGVCAEAKVVVSSGFPELDEAAVKAVRAARFTPAKSGTRRVSSIARLTLSFRLK